MAARSFEASKTSAFDDFIFGAKTTGTQFTDDSWITQDSFGPRGVEFLHGYCVICTDKVPAEEMIAGHCSSCFSLTPQAHR